MPNVDIKKYEDFVSNSPYGSFTQSSLWAKAKVDWDSELVAVYDHAVTIRSFHGVEIFIGHASEGDLDILLCCIIADHILKDVADFFSLLIQPDFLQ